MKPNKDLQKLRQDIIFTTTLHGREFTFHSTWGLFNPRDIDEGSRLLIENLKVDGQETILDLCCGYGAIGLALAPQTSGAVHMTDKDFVAIAYAQKNAKINQLKNCQIYLSNAFNQIPQEQKFDLIVSNLPAKVGSELLFLIINDAKEHLNKGGKFYVVTISGLKEYIKRNFNEAFGNYKKIAQGKTYTVSVAEK